MENVHMLSDIVNYGNSIIKNILGDAQSFAMDIAQNEPIVAGAILVWLLGTLTYMARNVPLMILNGIKNKVVYSITMNNINLGSEFAMQHFKDILEHKKLYGIHNFTINGHDQNSYRLTAGEDTCMFFHNGWPYIVTRSHTTKNKINSRYTSDESYSRTIAQTTISISTIGGKDKLNDIVEAIKQYRSALDCVVVTDWNGAHPVSKILFSNVKEIEKYKPVVLNSNVQYTLDTALDNYFKYKDWYKANGLTNNFGLLLSGPPGTGKTSLIRTIAARLKLHVNILAITSDISISEQIAESGDKIFLIEDVDAIFTDVSTNRQTNTTERRTTSLSELLNTLDGLIKQDRFLIMTTNHPEKLDPALIRKGRIDYHLVLGPLEPEAIERYFHSYYPDVKFPIEQVYLPRTGADLENIIIRHPNDPQAFITTLLQEQEEMSNNVNRQLAAE